MQPKLGIGIVGVIVVAAVAVTTGLVVHHNDQISDDKAMMQATTTHKQEQTKAVNDSVMKQKETDAMDSHNSMPNSSASTSSDTMSH